MQIRRFISEDARDAMLKVKSEMGLDAVILNTRKIRRKGIKGLFQKPLVEVVAAIDEKSAALPPSDDIRLKELEDRISAIDKSLRLYTKGMSRDEEEGLYNRTARLLYQQLLEQDVDKEYASGIATQAGQLMMKSDISARQAALEVLAAAFGPSCPIPAVPGKRRVVVFTGPTGIGKTTTLAKLAAIHVLRHKMRVGLITTDTFRIGAAEQLRIYAELLKIPLKVIYSPDEVHGPLKEYEDHDLVFIDTSGKSSKDKEHLEELNRLISESGAEDIYLTISATTGFKSLRAVYEGCSSLGDYQLILTKLDEAHCPGLLLNARMLFGKPVAYITNGQNVPDDIEEGNPGRLAEIILNSITL